MDPLTLHIVTYASSIKKRVLILSLLFVGGLGLYFLTGILLNNSWISIPVLLIFMLIAYIFSNRYNKITRIGTIQINDQSVELKKDQLSRSINLDTIASMHIKPGVKVDPENYVNSKSLLVDLTIKTGEVVSIHVEVENFDEDTCDLLDSYFSPHAIICTRKI